MSSCPTLSEPFSTSCWLRTRPHCNLLAAHVKTLESAGGSRALRASACARATAGATLPTAMPLPSVVFRRPCHSRSQWFPSGSASDTCVLRHEATQGTWYQLTQAIKRCIHRGVTPQNRAASHAEALHVRGSRCSTGWQPARAAAQVHGCMASSTSLLLGLASWTSCKNSAKQVQPQALSAHRFALERHPAIAGSRATAWR